MNVYSEDTIPILPAVIGKRRIYSPYEDLVVYVVNEQLPDLIARARQLRKAETKGDFTRFYLAFIFVYFTLCLMVAGAFYLATTLAWH